MCIPSRFPGNHIPLHRAVSRNHIFDDTGQHMTDMGLSVRGRRPVIKGIGRPLFPGIHALLEDIVLFPEKFYFFLSVYKIQAGINFLIHKYAPFFTSPVHKKTPSRKRTRFVCSFNHLLQRTKITLPSGLPAVRTDIIRFPVTAECRRLLLLLRGSGQSSEVIFPDFLLIPVLHRHRLAVILKNQVLSSSMPLHIDAEPIIVLGKWNCQDGSFLLFLSSKIQMPDAEIGRPGG